MHHMPIRRTLPAQHAWIVLVDGLQRIVAVFDAALPRFFWHAKAALPAESCYYVDASLVPPPAPGTIIDAESLRWVEVDEGRSPPSPLPAGPSVASQVFVIVDDDER